MRRTAAARPGIKWINDLYLRGKKICGILCESSVRDGRVDYAVLGIGLNVTTRIEDFPEELRETAGSLLTQTGFVFERGQAHCRDHRGAKLAVHRMARSAERVPRRI